MSATITSDRPSVADRALAAIPGVTELDTALAALMETPAARFVDTSSKFVALSAEARSIATQAVLDGQQIPSSVCADLAQLAAARQEVVAFNQILTELRNEMKSRREDALVRGVDDGLNLLAEELAGLLERVSEAGRAARGVPSSRRQESDEWNELTRLADDYEAIRGAQTALVNAVLRRDDDVRLSKVVQRVGLVRDFVDRTLFFVERRIDSHQFSTPTTEAAHLVVGWYGEVNTSHLLAALGSSPWWPGPERERYLVELARSGMAWVPSMDTARGACFAALTATERVRGHVEDRQVAARRTLFELTDIEDPLQLPAEQATNRARR